MGGASPLVAAQLAQSTAAPKPSSSSSFDFAQGRIAWQAFL